MLLADWMRINSITQVKLAEDARIGQGYISEYLAGNKGLGKNTAAKIVEATKGEVSLEELLFPEKYGKRGKVA